MTTHTFQVRPGIAPPADAVDVPLTNIRPTMEPVGPIKVIMDQLNGSYDVYERARIAQTWFDLFDAGLLAKLDQLYLYGRTLNDMLIPWIPGGAVAVNHGATFSAGTGLQFVGSQSDYIDTGIVPSLGDFHYTINSASFAVLVTESPLASDYVYAAAMSASPVSLQRGGTGGVNMASKMNTQDLVTDTAAGGSLGVFMGNRTSATLSQLFLNGDLIEEEAANASTAVPTAALTIARAGSTAYATMRAGGWAVGAGLTAQEARDLSAIMLGQYQRLI